MTDAEMLARLRVAAVSGRLASDLGKWVLERVQIPAADRLRARTLALREAGRLLPGGRWAKAKQILELLRGFRAASDVFAQAEIDQSTAPGLVLYALRVDPQCPDSLRQLMRILD